MAEIYQETIENIAPVSIFELPPLETHFNSLIRGLPGVPSFEEKVINYPGSIPVYKGSSTNQLLKSKLTSRSRKTNGDNEKAGDESDFMDIDHELKYYVDISSFLPKTRNEKLNTITIKNFPLFKLFAIEKILTILLSEAQDNSIKFSWSMIDYEFLENRLLFVRLKNYKNIIQFYRLLEKSSLFKNLELHVDNELDLSTETQDDVHHESAKKEEIEKIIQNSKLYEKSTNKDEEDELSYFKTYKVETSELVDVPNDFRESVTRDIIKFRSKVLKVEKERRKKEIEKEHRHAKLRMKKLFEEIKESNGENIESESDENEESDSEKNTNDIGDEEYEILRKEKEEDEVEKEYLAKEKSLSRRENIEKNKLLDTLSAFRKYESNLIDNKSKYINEFKNFKDFDSYEVKNYLYYKNHSQYVKTRLQQKAKEEELDEKDRVNEQTDIKSMNKTNEFLSSFMAQQNPIKLQIKQEDLNIGALNEESLAKVKSRISQLIEEYLGFEDEELTDFVYDFILSNNNKQELITELAETLDDDAKKVADNLWEFIKELS